MTQKLSSQADLSWLLLYIFMWHGFSRTQLREHPALHCLQSDWGCHKLSLQGAYWKYKVHIKDTCLLIDVHIGGRKGYKVLRVRRSTFNRYFDLSVVTKNSSVGTSKTDKAVSVLLSDITVVMTSQNFMAHWIEKNQLLLSQMLQIIDVIDSLLSVNKFSQDICKRKF